MENVVVNNIFAENLLLTLQYFEVFSYPLNKEEIRSNCSIVISDKETEKALKELEEKNIIFSYKGFYSTNIGVKSFVERRLAGNKLADKEIKHAITIGRFLYSFPFVRFVGISGSLSKGFSKPEGDYDYFILTEKNKLWICRTFLHLFKKFTFLFGQQHKFCMNYFMDIDHIEIEEKNIYTAIELSTLLPVSGSVAYEKLMSKNRWIKELLPNDYKTFYAVKPSNKKWKLMRWFEFPLAIYGDKTNSLLMKLTDWKWKRKWARKNYPEEDYELAFKTTLYQSKNHPANYQKVILERLKKTASQNNIDLLL